ncbi:hypothetical protein [Nostoc sp.]|uniref:hypothetical protein n=1 Tax=Nostoc sp. TaxID=1180 RepID=UPI002FFC75D5
MSFDALQATQFWTSATFKDALANASVERFWILVKQRDLEGFHATCFMPGNRLGALPPLCRRETRPPQWLPMSNYTKPKGLTPLIKRWGLIISNLG